MTDKYERFVKWYLRFNGYFTVDNFIVHAGDDPSRISNGIVGNYTETDILGIRMPYSREVKRGDLNIANHAPLVNGSEGKFDIVIGEAKSGESNSPNSVWRKKVSYPIEYIIRFIGLYENDADITRIASELMSKYASESTTSRVRYIVFSKEVDKHWQAEGVTYITFEEIMQFLIDVRGQSWLHSGIGVTSIHDQWDPMINKIFAIANDSNLSPNERIEKALDLLEQA